MPLAKFPHSISVMLRVFLELSVDHYLNSAKIPLDVKTPGGPKPKKLNLKVREAVDGMIEAGTAKSDLKGITKGVDSDRSPLSIDTLHNYVHSGFFSPTERDLTVAWDNAQMFFQNIWK